MSGKLSSVYQQQQRETSTVFNLSAHVYLRKQDLVKFWTKQNSTVYRRTDAAINKPEFFRPTGFYCGRPIGLELIARVSERPGNRQRQFQKTVKDVSVSNVLMHTAH